MPFSTHPRGHYVLLFSCFSVTAFVAVAHLIASHLTHWAPSAGPVHADHEC
ncbi:hypothetical protein Smp_191080 [Schistosoma mansoni]|uniref:hypothetical protein n=1 Tax=Schistosoma mansoni TaxID=6183 RepID=UPI00019B389E|nr:hypothetical protein Smp_191080 [Schistosoma mansoni]|eukprot:XP_018644100.1 hypothetical protein Smp_191080 [Schistosoma mansoni]